MYKWALYSSMKKKAHKLQLCVHDHDCMQYVYPVELIAFLNSTFTKAPSTRPSTASSLPEASFRTDSSLVLSPHTQAVLRARNTHEMSRARAPGAAIFSTIGADRGNLAAKCACAASCTLSLGSTVPSVEQCTSSHGCLQWTK